MNLVIDIGNTRSKLAVFEHDKLIHREVAPTFAENKISFLFKRFAIRESMLSTVAAAGDEITKVLQQNSRLVILDSKTPLPIKNLYKTPLTLGKDRIAAAAGAFALYPHENALVIDIGTAITCEFINDRGEYLGGSIAPGIHLRFKALNQYTSHLPLIEAEAISFLTGASTKDCILSGVMNGIRFELEGAIREYQSIYFNMRVLLTGGDAGFFETALKSKIFALPDLVLIGLNKILQHNASPR